MSKAEKFISDCTRNCSNLMQVPTLDDKGNIVPEAHPWLTPEDALRAVEIAKEEVMERACNAYCKVCGHYAHKTPTYICRQACDYYRDFKQAMKDE